MLATIGALILVIGGLAGGRTANAALAAVSGYAYGEKVTTTTVLSTTVASGPLPQAGPFNQAAAFSASNTVLSVAVPTLLSTGTLNVQTAGDPATGGNSTASVQTVNALTGTLTADAASAQCAVTAGGSTSGASSLANALLAGAGALAATPGPNTTIAFSAPLAGGTLTLNEQTYNASTNTLTVNAIHLHVTSGTALGAATALDIVISHVECDGTVAVSATPTPTPPAVTPTASPTPAASNPPIPPTNGTPPASTVTSGPSSPTTSTSWSVTSAGTDNIALASIALYVKTPGATGYTLADTKAASGVAATVTFVYSPSAGAGTYSFYSLARNLAGNVESAPTAPELTVVYGLQNVGALPNTSTSAGGSDAGLAVVLLSGLLLRAASRRRRHSIR